MTAVKTGEFSERLRRSIAERGLTQSELSQLSGVSKSSISRYISGAWKAKQDTLYDLARALNVSEAWLMGYDVPMERQETYMSEDLAKNIAAIETMSDRELDEEFKRLYDLLDPDEKDMIRASIEGIINAKKKKD